MNEYDVPRSYCVGFLKVSQIPLILCPGAVRPGKEKKKKLGIKPPLAPLFRRRLR